MSNIAKNQPVLIRPVAQLHQCHGMFLLFIVPAVLNTLCVSVYATVLSNS